MTIKKVASLIKRPVVVSFTKKMQHGQISVTQWLVFLIRDKTYSRQKTQFKSKSNNKACSLLHIYIHLLRSWLLWVRFILD